MLDHGTPEHAADDPVEALRHRMRHSAPHVMADAAPAVAIPGGGR